MSSDVQPRAARASGAERLYRVLLRAYPRPFRERWGVAMLEVVRERQATSGGRLAPVVRWLLRDVATSVPREWWRTLRGEERAAGFVRRRRKQRARRNAMSRMLDDFRAAARALARRPMFGLLVALTLALGIGANTAIFSVVRAVVLRPLPFEEAERLVAVRAGKTASKELLDRLRVETRTVERLEAYSGWTVTLTGEGEPEELVGIAATPGLFSLLGTQTQLGRGLLAEDAATGGEPVVVISHGLWQSRFGGDPRVLSSRLLLGTSGRQGEERRRVVGVLAPDFWFPDGRYAAGEVDVVMPLRIDPADREDYGGSWYLTVLGILAPGVNAPGATAELQQVMRRLAVTDFPSLNDEEALSFDRVTTVQSWMVRDVARPLWLLLGAVLLVLLLACTNVANLFLVRACARERELSLRLALGAARGRVVAQLVYEGLLLALLGGALGTGVAAGLVRLLRSRLDGVPRADQIGVDGPVLLFALLLAGASALLCALPPALRATGWSLSPGAGASGGTLAALRGSAGAGAST
ncbi:MAG TPA: ABC transporter permease, partial [Thermoanaerobaculia bacterium]|nr:ABC transporter permease [Thermoanaerobaculia bacterium]